MSYNYCDQVNKALGTSYSKHASLRTCLDPGSDEWNQTTMEERVEVLKKLVAAGNDLQQVISDYKITYTDMDKPHVVNNLPEGLTEIVKYLLKQ